MSAKLDDFDVDISDFGNTDLNLDDMKSKMSTFTSEKLCEMIVCDRYFGCFNDLAIMSMEELANRRIKGDTFDFEKHIDNSLKDLPKLDFSIPDISNVMRQLAGQMIKGK